MPVMGVQMIVFGLSKVLADPGNFSVRENLMRRRFCRELR